jgi:hypothetical protein
MRTPGGAVKMKTAYSSSEGSTLVRRARKDAEDRQNIINNNLVKKQFRGTTRGTYKTLVCLFFA